MQSDLRNHRDEFDKIRYMHLYLFAPDTRCPIEVMGLASILFGTLSIWVSLGSGRWLVRLAIWVSAICSLLLIGAYDAIVLISCFGAMLIMPLALIRLACSATQVRFSDPSKTSLFKRAELWLGISIGGAILASFVNMTSGSVVMRGFPETILLGICSLGLPCLLFAELVQRWHSRPTFEPKDESAKRLSLQEALLGVLLVAAVFACVSYANEKNQIEAWISLLISSAILATCHLAVCAVVLPIRWRWKLLGAINLICLPWMFRPWGLGTARWLTSVGDYSFIYSSLALKGREQFWDVIAWAYILVLLVLLWSAAACQKIAFRNCAKRAECLHRLGWLTMVALGAAIVSPMILLSFQIGRPLPKPDSYVGENNAFDELLRDLKRNHVLNPAESSMATIRASGNEKLLSKVRENNRSIEASIRSGFTPVVDDSESRTSIFELTQELSAVRSWCRHVDSEALDSIAAGEFDRASQQWETCLRLGSQYARGSDMMRGLTGIALEGLWQTGVAQYRNELSVGRIAELLVEMKRIDRDRETWESCQRTSAMEGERTFGWRFRVSLSAASVFSSKRSINAGGYVGGTGYTPSMEAFLDARNRRDAVHRMLMVEFAIQLFKQEYGRPPQTLKELVPTYFNAVPVDPHSGGPLLLAVQENTACVYSVGRDTQDNGGKFGSGNEIYQTGNDFDVDTLWRTPPASLSPGTTEPL